MVLAAGAVRLLTIHGAKGLEADVVLLLDTDANPRSSDTMAVLVDWPGEASCPQRLVFLASESKPPRCVADALATIGVTVDVLDLRWISPFDREAVQRSVQKTRRLLVVHEDNVTAGFGAEVIAAVADGSVLV